MISQLLMQADAVLLVLIALCCAILVCESRDCDGFFPRAMLVVFACVLCLQSAWLLGIWIPGVAGYPWPRLSVDFALFVLAVWRVLMVLSDNRRAGRRLRDLARTQRRARLNG